MKKFSVIILFVFAAVFMLSMLSGCACSCGNEPELPENIPPVVEVTETDVTPTDVTPTDTVPSEPFVTLVRGDKGDRVAEVQSRLIELGYLKDVADGSFGGRTRKAVVAFQSAVKLPESGEVDEATTYTALMSENAPEANSEQKTTTTTVATTTTKKKTEDTSSKKTTTTEKKETTTKKTTTTQKKTTTTEKKETTTKKTTTTQKSTTKKTTTTTKPTTTKKTTTTTKPTTTKKTTTTTKPTTTTEKTTTTTKPTTTTTKTTTTTAKPTTTTKATTTTTKATRWVNKSAMDGIKSELKSYAKSLGMTWDTSLNKDTAYWGSQTRAYTTGYSKSEYVSTMKGIIKYIDSKNAGYEYINIIITSHTNGEYLMTCYFG